MSIPPIVYTANVRLGGGGMGTSLAEILRGLVQNNLLKQLIVSSYRATDFPPQLITSQGLLGRIQKRLAFYERTGWGDWINNRLFDLWVSRIMQPADLFESWTGFCASSLARAQKRGSRTLLNHGSAHPRTQIELINAERVQWGLASMRATPLVDQVEREMALADQVLVQSRFSERTLVERGVNADKIVRIPLGVNVARFQPDENLSSHPFRVLFLGQVTLRKGVSYLLEAWKQLGWRDAELWLVGKVMADCTGVLKRYADLPGLQLKGYLPDQVASFQASDVFVSPSVEDGFGLVVTEAMACGLPVIVSDHTGAADVVQDGGGGIIVPYNQVAAYAEALEHLRRHPEQAGQMGQAAKANVERMTWSVYQEKLVAFHHKVLS